MSNERHWHGVIGWHLTVVRVAGIERAGRISPQTEHLHRAARLWLSSGRLQRNVDFTIWSFAPDGEEGTAMFVYFLDPGMAAEFAARFAYKPSPFILHRPSGDRRPSPPSATCLRMLARVYANEAHSRRDYHTWFTPKNPLTVAEIAFMEAWRSLYRGKACQVGRATKRTRPRAPRFHVRHPTVPVRHRPSPRPAAVLMLVGYETDNSSVSIEQRILPRLIPTIATWIDEPITDSHPIEFAGALALGAPDRPDLDWFVEAVAPSSPSALLLSPIL